MSGVDDCNASVVELAGIEGDGRAAASTVELAATEAEVWAVASMAELSIASNEVLPDPTPTAGTLPTCLDSVGAAAASWT